MIHTVSEVYAGVSVVVCFGAGVFCLWRVCRLFANDRAARGLILDLLRKAGRPMTGLELIEASAGRLERGVIYVQLGWLEDHGFVRSEPVPASDLTSMAAFRRAGAMPVRRRYIYAVPGDLS